MMQTFDGIRAASLTQPGRLGRGKGNSQVRDIVSREGQLDSVGLLQLCYSSSSPCLFPFETPPPPRVQKVASENQLPKLTDTILFLQTQLIPFSHSFTRMFLSGVLYIPVQAADRCLRAGSFACHSRRGRGRCRRSGEEKKQLCAGRMLPWYSSLAVASSPMPSFSRAHFPYSMDAPKRVNCCIGVTRHGWYERGRGRRLQGREEYVRAWLQG